MIRLETDDEDSCVGFDPYVAGPGWAGDKNVIVYGAPRPGLATLKDTSWAPPADKALGGEWVKIWMTLPDQCFAYPSGHPDTGIRLEYLAALNLLLEEHLAGWRLLKSVRQTKSAGGVPVSLDLFVAINATGRPLAAVASCMLRDGREP